MDAKKPRRLSRGWACRTSLLFKIQRYFTRERTVNRGHLLYVWNTDEDVKSVWLFNPPSILENIIAKSPTEDVIRSVQTALGQIISGEMRHLAPISFICICAWIVIFIVGSTHPPHPVKGIWIDPVKQGPCSLCVEADEDMRLLWCIQYAFIIHSAPNFHLNFYLKSAYPI